MVLTDERRHYQRVERQLDVRISRAIRGTPYEESEIDIGSCVNISASGLLVNLSKTKKRVSLGAAKINAWQANSLQEGAADLDPPAPLRTDDEITVIFLKPNTFEIFKSCGKVVRIEDVSGDSYMVGIEFNELSPFEMEKLNYYVMLSSF